MSTNREQELISMYIELIKKTLMHSIWHKKENSDSKIESYLKSFAPSIFGYSKGSIEDKIQGKIWPEFAHTMIGQARLENIQFCIETVIKEKIEGDLIETGVWRGGACIFMRAMLKAYDIQNKSVWVADSFEGLPPPNIEKSPKDKGDKHYKYKNLAVSIDEVMDNFNQYNLLDSQVKFLKGFFKDTLPNAPIEKLSICRLDGDMYESTMDAITALYPKLEKGGFLIVDDYHAVKGCKEAIHDYISQEKLSVTMIDIDWASVYWRKQ